MLAATPRCDILPPHARGLLSPASPHPSSALGRLAWSLGPLILWEHKDTCIPCSPRREPRHWGDWAAASSWG